jgi:hypothetical protein
MSTEPERPVPIIQPVTSRSVLMRITVACVAIRVALEGIGLAALAVDGQPVASNVLSFWNRWDAHHYLRLAEVGYVTSSPFPNGDDPLYIVFFPFFPAAVRLVSFVVRDVVASGLFVSLLATIGAAWFLQRLVALDAGDDEGWRAVVLLFAFPTAYFLAAPYSEALFLFAVLGSIYAARTNMWFRSGLFGILATGTRVTGIALLPALIAEAMSGDAPRGVRVRRLALTGLSVAGLLLYFAINLIVWDDPLHFLQVQRSHWYQHLVVPWQPLTDSVEALASGDGRDPLITFVHRMRLVGFVFAVPVLIAAVRRLRTADWIYGLSGFVLILSASWLLSLPRYLLVLYPIFMVGAKLTASLRVFVPVVAASVALQVVFFLKYAVGGWTF